MGGGVFVGAVEARPIHLAPRLVVPVGSCCLLRRPLARRPLARTPLCSTTQTATGRTAVQDGRARRWAVGSAAGSAVVGRGRSCDVWLVAVALRLFAPCEREARHRQSALTDARVTSPQGLNLGAGLVPGGARQSGGGAGYGGRDVHGGAERHKLVTRSVRILLRQMRSASNCNTDD